MKAAIFDLDGTIVLSHPTHFESYLRFFREFGIEWTEEEFKKKFLIKSAADIIQSVLERHGIKNIDISELITKKRDIFNKIIEERPLDTVPGFFDFIKKLNAIGLKKAIASGSNKGNIEKMLASIGVLGEFPVIVSATEVARPKPAPNIFLRAAELLEVAPEDCFVLEDTIYGVEAAHLAGMYCVAFTTTNKNTEELKRFGANEVYENYTKINLNAIMCSL